MRTKNIFVFKIKKSHLLTKKQMRFEPVNFLREPQTYVENTL